MGGGDLNMKKSWHPLLLKNQERVWLEEKKALEEKKKLDQLRKEKEEERQLQELQRMQEEQNRQKAAGETRMDDYLLGKKRVDKILTADDNAKLGASHKNFIAIQNANNARDIQAKIREDPLLAIKQQEQAAYQSLMSNPLRLREMQERNGIQPKKDKKERKREKEERKRLKAERKHRRERDSRSLSPRDHRHSRSPNDRRRSRSPYNRRRSPSPSMRRSGSRDRDYHRLPRHDDRHSSRYSPERRRRGDSRSPMRDDRGRDRDSYLAPPSSQRRSMSPRHDNSRRSRSPAPRYSDDRHSGLRRYRADRSRSPQRRAPPPPPRQSRPPEKDAKTLAEERAARLAAMTSNANDMQVDRKQRLAELLEKEKAELAREEQERVKSAKSGGVGSFMSADYKKVYGGEGGLEDRIRRARGTLVVDYPVIEEDETPFFDSVDELQQHGINVQDILKLKGMSEAKVEKIKEAAHKILGSSFATGVEIQERRRRVHMISTGSKSVDAILGGSLQMRPYVAIHNRRHYQWLMKPLFTDGMELVYGEFRTGKTQMAHTMSVVAQLPPDLGGAAGKVAYIDTEGIAANESTTSETNATSGTFRPDRIKAIADRFGVDGTMALENILYARAFNSEHQMELINECSLRFAEDKDFRLLIVDSIMALFRVDFSGRGELSERQQKVDNFHRAFEIGLTSLQLAQMLSKLTKLSEEYNIAILLTNQVQSDPGATMTFVAGGALKPIGGHILSHASATRLYLRKGRAEERVAKLVDSPDRPESEASYKLDEGGWNDV
ncbi:hypothetical protein NP233_g2688 [Leucocoprinus birnbaumii]|uniref:Uncharacterized protein n=1 Tax=Leucocoprinus birnbaumii TaxID=56174 RepID=A0AAD5VXV8_9AGAR|nr:hypothetical protein NP233_g2688 [Leucocoprinus birnbaumii]